MTDKLGVELGEARLALAVEDQEGVDHDDECIRLKGFVAYDPGECFEQSILVKIDNDVDRR